MIALQVPKTDRDFAARWFHADETEGACHGVVEIHIGEDVYQDEFADSREAAQKWVDDFDFEELERGAAEADYEPDFDPYDLQQ